RAGRGAGRRSGLRQHLPGLIRRMQSPKEATMTSPVSPDRYWTSRISAVTGEKVYIRGYDLENLIGDLPFTAAAYLLIRGRLPTPSQVRALDGVLSAVLDY